MNLRANLYKAEVYFFYVVLFLNLYPAFSGKFFPTLDGAAHLYNSNLIPSLLFNNTSILNNFFVLNHDVIPNWTGHFILTFLNFFFPAYIAEKTLILFYLIALPISFRILIKTINTSSPYFSYLIFPFTYNYLFLLGFYNFSLAIVFLFITVNYWLKKQNQKLNFRITLIFSLLFLLTFFSHIFIFIILLLVIGLQIIVSGFFELKGQKGMWQYILKNEFFIVSTSIIPIILTILYFVSHIEGTTLKVTYEDSNELLNWIKNLRPLIGYNIQIEEYYTKKINYLLLMLTLLTIAFRVYSFIKSYFLSKEKSEAKLIKAIDIWLAVSFILLLLYFNIPDSDSQAGYVSIRLCLLFYLFLIIWISVQQFSKWIYIVAVSLVLYCNYKLHSYYSIVLKDLNCVVENCCKASSFIEANSVVLPINNSDSWLQGHFSNYLGIDKPMIILENYEANTNYFPIKWKEKDLQKCLIENINSVELNCLPKKIQTNFFYKIDYIFILENNSSSKNIRDSTINFAINNNFKKIFQSNIVTLYERL